VVELGHRALVYDRIDANRRATRTLLVAFAAALLPAAAYLAQYLMMWVAMLVGVTLAALGLIDEFSEGNLELWLALIALITLALIVALGWILYAYSAAAVLRITGAGRVGRDQEPELYRAIENLCIGAGLPQPSVYVIEADAPNAFATGLDPEHASVAVTRGLLTLLDYRELEGVLAHELAQIGNYDTRLGTVLAVGVGLLRLPFVIVVRIIRFLFRIHWAVGAGLVVWLGLPLLLTIPFGIQAGLEFLKEDTLTGVIFLLAMILPFYVFLAAPIIAHLIRVAVLRRRELLADADATLLARYAEGLARALVKTGAVSMEGLSVGGATAHLWFVDPLPPDAPWWDRLFPTHPTLDKRIEFVSAMGSGVPLVILQRADEEARAFSQTREQPSASIVGASSGVPAVTFDEEEFDGAQTPIAYRLNATETIVHQDADAASAEVERLPQGSLVTITESKGGFLYVITSKDQFGYIADSCPMTAAEAPSG
jgi:heat shock protein HtpX